MKRLLTLLVLTFIFLSCDDNVPLKKGKIFNRILIKDTLNQMEQELYISGNDTIVNQSWTYKNGKLDSLQSNFYDLKLHKFNDGRFKAQLNYFTPTLYQYHPDSIQSGEVIVNYMTFAKDSMVIKEVVGLLGQRLEFEFTLSEKYKSLHGIIYENSFVHDGRADSISFISRHLFLDVAQETENPFALFVE